MNIRLLKPNEIEVRIGTINEKGATLLLYKDARTDMNILDESGVKWQRSHELIDGKLFCTISVWDDDIKEWISRQDVGTESNTEKEKGQASDAFKRAGFNFGIGRELYTAPFIWIPADAYNGFKNANGKWATYDKFEVADIGYDENKEINRLIIKNKNKKFVVFEMGKRITSSDIDDQVDKIADKKEYKPRTLENKMKYATPEQKQLIANHLLKVLKVKTEEMNNYLFNEYDVPVDSPMTAEKAEELIFDMGIDPFDNEPGINQDGSYNK